MPINETETEGLRKEVTRLKEKNRQLMEQIQRSEYENGRLMQQNVESQQRISELEKQIGERGGYSSL